MSIANYAQLKQWIADNLGRDDLTAIIPNLIALAEANMQRRLSKEPSLYEWASATTTTSNDIVDVTGMYRLHGASIAGHPLRIVNPGMIRPNSGKSGTPDMLSFEGGARLRLYPVPDSAYTIDILHTPVISPSLAGGEPDDTATNWILQLAPELYQYGALAHAASYIQDDARIQGNAQIYQSAMTELIASKRHGDIADSPDPLHIGMLDNDSWSIRNG